MFNNLSKKQKAAIGCIAGLVLLFAVGSSGSSDKGASVSKAFTESSVSNVIDESEISIASEKAAEVETVSVSETVSEVFTDSVTETNAQASEEPATDIESTFWVKYIDVGQGDAALVQCDGHYMLIDGGPVDASSLVYTVLKDEEVETLDVMIATHPDEDHIGGLSGALNFSTVKTCFSPVTEFDSVPFENMVKYLDKNSNISLTTPGEYTSFELGSAHVDLMCPISEAEDNNELSIITRVQYGENAFLFMGDADLAEENALIDSERDISCDVLKIGHHGSKNSAGDDFLDVAAPAGVIISVGGENSYGHPSEEVMKRLTDRNIKIYRTDMQGDVVCHSDGKNLTFATEKEASAEALLLAGPASKSTIVKNGVVIPTPKEVAIPEGTTYVLNTNSKRFHIPTCGSVKNMLDKNKEYSQKSAEELVAEGYKPCGNCKPYHEKAVEAEEETVTSVTDDFTVAEEPQGQPYVLNTNTKKFHCPNCASVSSMKASNQQDVTMTREEIIKMGYEPCKRCKP